MAAWNGLDLGAARREPAAAQLLEGRKRVHQQVLETLRAIDERPGDDPPFVDLVLRWGLAFNEWGVEWCTEQLQRLSAEKTTAS